MINVPGYKVGGTLYTAEEIHEKVKELGRRISEDYKGRPLTVVGILKGAFVFMSDLIREIDADVQLDFIAAASYGNKTESSGEIQIKKDMDITPAGKDILIIEDIIDSGNTLKYLRDVYLAGKNAKSVRIATLLSKPSRRKVDIEPDYNGFVIDDLFVVGYGLDYAQQYRQLPYIAWLEEENPEL